MVGLLGERSQRNSYVKHVLGLYLYATGAQRQVLSVLSHLGICSSYPIIAGRGATHSSVVADSETIHNAQNNSDTESEDPDSDFCNEEDMAESDSDSDIEPDLASDDSGLSLFDG